MSDGTLQQLSAEIEAALVEFSRALSAILPVFPGRTAMHPDGPPEVNPGRAALRGTALAHKRRYCNR